MTTGQKLKQVRETCGFSREEFCEYTNIPYPTLARLEQDKSVPNLRTLFRISEGLNMEVSELLADVNSLI